MVWLLFSPQDTKELKIQMSQTMRQFSTLPGFRSTGCFFQIKQLLDPVIVKLLIPAQPSGATVANERAAHWLVLFYMTYKNI